MADPNITVNAKNSPFPIQAGTQGYGTVTIEAGGSLELQQQTNLTIATVNKTSKTKVTSVTQKR